MEASNPPAARQKRGPEQQREADREKRAKASEEGASREPTQEPMPGSVFFHALMDEMSEIMGTAARSLDKDEVRGEVPG